MRRLLITSMMALALVLLTTCYTVSQSNVEYEIFLRENGTADWTVKQTLTINDTYDDLEQFSGRIRELVDTAQNETGRHMFADVISIKSMVLGSYVSVEYAFYWEKFSQVENDTISIGDIFQVDNFFSKLYGDGKVQVTYPVNHSVKTVTPTPSQIDEAACALEWLGTIDFHDQNVRIILEKKISPPDSTGASYPNILLLLSLAAIAVGLAAGYCVFKFWNRKRAETAETQAIPSGMMLESDEEKVLKLLRSQGGNAFQSDIAEHLKFSRAKTSQLLTALEKKAAIKRIRRGRDKIVVLSEDEKKE